MRVYKTFNKKVISIKTNQMEPLEIIVLTWLYGSNNYKGALCINRLMTTDFIRITN